jgi:hypothetical protein
VYDGETDPNGVKMVVIPEPKSGNYKVELTGSGTGQYHMAAANFSDSGDNVNTVAGDISQGQKIGYDVVYDSSIPDAPTQISAPQQLPSDQPIEKPAKQMLQELISDTGNYFQNNPLAKKSLLFNLNSSLAMLERIDVLQGKLATAKYPKLVEAEIKALQKLIVFDLNQFVVKINWYQSKKIIIRPFRSSTPSLIRANSRISRAGVV